MGSGKSTFGSHALGFHPSYSKIRAPFKFAKGSRGVTKDVALAQYHNLSVWDTPGFGDPEVTAESFIDKHMNQIYGSLSKENPE